MTKTATLCFVGSLLLTGGLISNGEFLEALKALVATAAFGTLLSVRFYHAR